MPDDEVSLTEIYAEVDKRIKAAVDLLEAKIAELEKRVPPAKKPFKVLRDAAS